MKKSKRKRIPTVVSAVPQTAPLSRRKLFLSLLLVAALGFGVYANSLNGQFLWDDLSLVQNNPYLKDWSYLPKIVTSSIATGSGQATSFYRPVQIFTYLVDYSLWRTNVLGFHLTNVLLHILVALAVFGFVQALFRNPALSLLTSLFFVVHPLHTEAVAYISGRADPLAALFILLCMILYLRNLELKNTRTILLIGSSYVLALLSRENSLILLLLLPLYHVAFQKPVEKKSAGVLIAITAAYISWRAFLWQQIPFEAARGRVPELWERLPGFFVAFVNYLKLLPAPFHLHMEYGGLLFPWTEPKVALGVLLLGVILVCVFFLGQGLASEGKNTSPRRLLFFSGGWFLITLLPASNIFYLINAYMAEHWLYLPSVGFFLMLSYGLIVLARQKNFKIFAMTTAIGLLVFYSYLTIRQNVVWREPIGFYKRMIEYAPFSARIYNNLAEAYHAAGRQEELVGLLQKAVQIEPDNIEALNNLGNAYKETGRYEEAAVTYKKAIAMRPNEPGPYYNLALLVANIRKNNQEAAALLNKAIELSPYYAPAYHKLGLLYLEEGKKEEAVALLKRALKLNPDEPQIYHSLGYVYYQTDRMEDARAMYEKAIKIDPRYAQAYHDLAIIYLSGGQYRLAIEYCDKALSLGHKDEALLEALKSYR